MFEMGMLHTSDWKARWIGWRPSQRTPTTSGANLAAPMPSPLLKKEFAVAKPVREAKLYVCGLGLYDLRINGQRMDDTVLNPAHTQYDKRVLYTAHDVTHLIHRGANCVGVELGRGFYSVREQTPWLWTTAPWNSPPKLLCQILLQYTDGTTQRIVSDTSWQLCTDGPTRSDSIYWGESYDARKEKTGWDRPGYHQGDFVPADLMDPPSGALRSQMLPPMKIVETRKPMSVKSPKAGCYLFDVGPMTTGWIQFTAACPKGTMITIRYSERLSADGTADKVRINNVDGPIQTDTYVFKGEGQETWEPKFSYKGFKYVEVSGCPIRLTLANVQVKVIHSAVTPIGSFQCSNPLFNTIHAATVRTILNNLHGKPTDTPVYEKNGWMGDANLIAETALFNFDLTSFFEKWVRDIGDSMGNNGVVPIVVPTGAFGRDHSPEWNCAYIFLPYHLDQYCGDASLLREQYAGLRSYIGYEKGALRQGISSSVLNDWYAPSGARHNPNAPEGGALTATAYAYRAFQLFGEISAQEQRQAEVTGSNETCAQIKAAFNANFLDRQTETYHNKRRVGYRQTSSILPLVWEMVPQPDRKAVLNNLIADIHTKGDHLDTGILGTKYLLPLLTESGHGDVAYAIANQKTYPSWGWWIAHGATTLWESWDLDARSNDHYMFGTIDEWFYKYLAGIRPGKDGFKEFTIKPYLLGDLTYARAEVDTVRGEVSSSWKKLPNHGVDLEVTVPVNCAATLYVPSAQGARVLENGQPAEKSLGLRFLRAADGYAIYRAGSGHYHFVSTALSSMRP
ncbi:MAG TPA: family 78 glycoside hydrolase catalytic domain [Chthonomonadaceae bacterium]|nr:family 78 glycoside hydrolase catalytic domain [Chthonomonadaceae bacterium]